MSAFPPQPPVAELEAVDQFLVSYGKSGAVGVFTGDDVGPLRRGTAVVIQTSRGIERGSILGPATLRQARVVGAVSSGSILRVVTEADEEQQCELKSRAESLFAASRASARDEGLALDILDVDMLFDGRTAILQFIGAETNLDVFAAALQTQFDVIIRLENLVAPMPEEHGCGKPDCGRGAGGCTDCSSGGGCSSCGSHKVDMREYFAHLRTQMEQRRTPLL